MTLFQSIRSAFPQWIDADWVSGRGRELLYLYAVELVHIDLHELEYIKVHLSRCAGGTQDFEFNQPQFPVCYNKKVSAPARWVEELQAGDLFQQFKELLVAAFCCMILGPEFV